MSLETYPFSNVSLTNVHTPFVDLSGLKMALTTLPPIPEKNLSRESFVKNLSEIVSQAEGHRFDSKNLTSLDKILRKVTVEWNPTIKEALTKKTGYFSRFFSNENWEEWLEPKTPLGRVVSVFADDTAASSKANKLAEYLSSQVIQDANDQAVAVLQQLSTQKKKFTSMGHTLDCTTGLAIGSGARLALKGPVPLWISLFNCIKGIDAQRGGGRNPNVAAARRAGNAREQILAHNRQTRKDIGVKLPPAPTPVWEPAPDIDPLNAAERVKQQWLEEMGQKIPDAFKVALKKANNWIECVTFGVKDFLFGITGINTPYTKLEEILSDYEDWYWFNKVYPEYTEIFKKPNEAWNRQGSRDYPFEIKQMRDKLNQHGYHFGYGTPLEFIDILKQRGVCERVSCNSDL